MNFSVALSLARTQYSHLHARLEAFTDWNERPLKADVGCSVLAICLGVKGLADLNATDFIGSSGVDSPKSISYPSA